MSLKSDVMFLGLGNCGCKQAKVFYEMGYNLNSALNYNEEGTGTFILNALKIAL